MCIVGVGGPRPILDEPAGYSSPPFPGVGLLLALAGALLPMLAEGRGWSSLLFLAGVCGWFLRLALRQSTLRALNAAPRHSWLKLVVVGGCLPILVGGRGCGSPPLLAGVCCWLWWVCLMLWGGWFCSACVRCVRRARSCVVVCAVLFGVTPAVPSVLVFAPVWVSSLRERLRVRVLVFGWLLHSWVALVCLGCSLLCLAVGAVWGWCSRGVRAGVCMCVWLCAVWFGVQRGVWVQLCGIWAVPYLFWSVLSADMVGDDKRLKIWLCKCVACWWMGGGRSGF